MEITTLSIMQASQNSKDKRTWFDIMGQFPYVREMLYQTRRVFLLSAEGASQKVPWHVSLCKLMDTGGWNAEEKAIIVQLLLAFVNNDFNDFNTSDEGKEETKDEKTIDHNDIQ